MISPLTIQIIIKNNIESIQDTLESILPLNGKILVADIGCTDSSIEICKKYGAEIIKPNSINDLSKVRNDMINHAKNDWNLFIEPWESIINGHEIIQSVINQEKTAYKFSLIKEDVITKQIRLWHKNTNLKFVNPVFENIKGYALDLDVFVLINENKNEDIEKLLENWRNKCPLSKEPIYYTACNHLKNKNWNSFLNFSELYLIQETENNMSLTMTYYYRAMVLSYVKKQYEEAIKSILICIAKQPTMAEFWCLLADIYYAIKDYAKAQSFYENATLIGCKRLKNDGWPVEISKYKEYPEKMIISCKNMQTSINGYLKN